MCKLLKISRSLIYYRPTQKTKDNKVINAILTDVYKRQSQYLAGISVILIGRYKYNCSIFAGAKEKKYELDKKSIYQIALLMAVNNSLATISVSYTHLGRDITFEPEYKRSKGIGRLFQDPLKGTAPNMTIEENLHLSNQRRCV